MSTYKNFSYRLLGGGAMIYGKKKCVWKSNGNCFIQWKKC